MVMVMVMVMCNMRESASSIGALESVQEVFQRWFTDCTECDVCVYVCIFFQFILDVRLVGRTSRGHKEGRSHRISHPPPFCGACINFSREKNSAVPFPRRP